MSDLSFFDRLALAWRVLTDSGVARRVADPADDVPVSTAPPPVQPTLASTPPDGALQLLGLLQREGRLVDFLNENVDGFSDSDVGSAARVVHQGCARALRDHFELRPVSEQSEGDSVVLESGFDASRYRFSGQVAGEPPFRGTLVHRGWEVTKTKMAKVATGHDLQIIAPAEVEL